MVAELRTSWASSSWSRLAAGVAGRRRTLDEMRRQEPARGADRGIDVQMWFEGPSRFLDATNPEARALPLGQAAGAGLRRARHPYVLAGRGRAGVRRLRLRRLPVPRSARRSRVGNIYPQTFSRAFFEGQQADGRGRDRQPGAVRLGGQPALRRAAVVRRHPLHLRRPCARQITAGIHMGVAGIPWFTTDIGGFRGADATDPAFHELLVRWFQLGAFLPGDAPARRPAAGEDVVAADGSPPPAVGAAQRAVELRRGDVRAARAVRAPARALRDYTARRHARRARPTASP